MSQSPSASWRCQRRQDPGVVRLTLAGEVDVGGVSALEVAVKAAQADAPLVVIDVGALVFLDVNGLRVLLDAHDRAQLAGQRLLIRSARRASRPAW